MYMKAVLIRFFKSFNFDYLRKHHPKAEPLPWEMIDGAWFPFVRIPLTKDVTTVVGANESGKSHLLSAIKKGLFGKGIERRDFCRYSQFFTVEEGRMRWPDFGLQFANFTPEEQEFLRKAASIPDNVQFDTVTLIRSNCNQLDVWLDDSSRTYSIANPGEFTKSKFLPKVFEIDSSVALPSSVPLSWLRGATGRRWGRKDRNDLVVAVDGLSPSLESQDKVKGAATTIFDSLSRFFGKEESGSASPNSDDSRAYALAKDLLFKVAKIDKAAVEDLSDALLKEDEGLVNGLLQQINQRLASSLNFPKWWVQDRDFRLTVSARDDDLVFTISDRTQTDYSFGERSNGLKYFLSYYIQYLAHQAPDDRHEILLMDEPDAYLSSQGQQDLLKIFNSFATPEDKRKAIQVVYVTHSPFLIDRNHAERIRVLEKGSGDEGTRVVNDASKNHYEPLRSSFGAFVGETAFIGNCNLMVEGIADQVMLAGWTKYVRASGSVEMNTLDLNRLTIVPAGSASHIPYLVYLARGRDIEQPSVIVLLDSDKAGLIAQKEIKRGPRGKQVLKPDYVLMMATLQPDVRLPNGKSLVETEDLIPAEILAVAVQRYLEAVCATPSTKVAKVTGSALLAAWVADKTLFDAIGDVVTREIDADMHVDKVALARHVNEVMHEHQQNPGSSPLRPEDVEAFRHNVTTLLARLAHLQRKAERDSTQERISQRIERSIRAFRRDHTTTARREDAMLLLEELEAVLDESSEADAVRYSLQQLRRTYDLVEPKPGMVDDFPQFSESLAQVRYSALNAVQEAEEGDNDTVKVPELVVTEPPAKAQPVPEATESAKETVPA